MKVIHLISIATALLAAGCSEVHPVDKQEIIHIHLEDAKAGYNQSFALDINDDGNSEFVFSATLIADVVGDHLRFAIISRYDNEVIGANGNVTALPEGESITSDSSFGFDNEVLVIKTTTQDGITWWGNWKGVQSKYVGVRFRVDGSVCYGWIKLSVNEPNEQIVIHEMAYVKGTGVSGILT
jgi:hypothetical protein